MTLCIVNLSNGSLARFLTRSLTGAVCSAVGLSSVANAQSTATPVEPQTAPVTQVPETPQSVKPKDEAVPKVEGNNDSGGLLGPVRLGASLSVAIPHPLNYGLDLTLYKYVGLAASVSSIEEAELDSYKGASFGLKHWDVRARVFPFAGSFFLGAAYGQQKLSAQGKVSVPVTVATVTTTVPATLKLEVNSNVFTPHLGWFWLWDFGLVLGTEFGYQMTLGNPKTDFSVTFEGASAAAQEEAKKSKEYKENEKIVRDLGDTVGKAGLPYWTFLRVGWMI